MGPPDASGRRTFSSSATAPPPTAGCPTAAVAADDARASAGAVMFEEVGGGEFGIRPFSREREIRDTGPAPYAHLLLW